MSRDNSPEIDRELQTVRLFLTEPHDCSYLAAEQATTAFVDPAITIHSTLYERLAEQGFRRSGRYHYRPHCQHCQACISVRVPVAAFVPNRSQKRCGRRNSDLQLTTTAVIDRDQHYALFERYIAGRHRDGDMYPASRAQFEDFLGSGSQATHYLEMWLDQRLVGCAVTDRYPHGLSAIYTYYEPSLAARGLGTLAILAQLQLARRWQLDYLYLGYWIAASSKMAYKVSFKPLEYFDGQSWSPEPPSL